MILSLVFWNTLGAEDGKDNFYIDEETKQQIEDPVLKKVGFYDLGSDNFRPTEPQDLELREDGSGIKITKTKNLNGQNRKGKKALYENVMKNLTHQRTKMNLLTKL